MRLRKHKSPPFPNQLAWAGCLLLLAACSGCATLSRNRVSEDIIAARRMSLQGADAMQHGKLKEAEVWFAEAVQTNPADERAHVQYAELLWQSGQRGAAITHMEKSVELSGGDAVLQARLGEMYLGRGDVDLAMRQAEQAIQSNRDLACAWALRGDVHRQRGDVQKALVDYHRSLSQRGFCPHVQLSLAAIYREQNRPRRALSTLEALAENYAPDKLPPQLQFEQGLAMKALGRYSDAADLFAQVAARDDAAAEAYFQLAEVRVLDGDPVSARLALAAALEREPHHVASLQLREQIDGEQPSLTAAVGRF